MELIRLGKLRITLGFFLALGVIWWLDRTVYMVWLLLSVFAHELAHILALRKANGRFDKIILGPFYIRIEMKHSLISYRDEIKVAFAGPLANLLAAAGAFLICIFYRSFPGAPFFILANVGIFLLNMLPAEFLDGGRILKAWLLTEMDPDVADKFSAVISGVCMFPLLAAGWYLLQTTGYNFSLLAIGLYMAANFLLRLFRQRKNSGVLLA